MAGNFNLLMKSVGEMEIMNKFIENGMKHTLTTLSNIMECDPDSKGKQESLKVTMMQFVRMQLNIKKYYAIVVEVKRELEQTEDYKCVNVDELLQSKMKDVTDQEVCNHPKMKEFESLLNCDIDGASSVTNGSVDNDMIMTQSDMVIHDPITKKQMVLPVTNKHCKHSYDRESIIKYMASKRSVKCPYAGCPNRIPLNENHLEMNLLLKKYIEKKNKN